jgi:hypothetical protein
MASFCLASTLKIVNGIIKSEMQNETNAPREAVRNKAIADSIMRPRYIHARRGLFSTADM